MIEHLSFETSFSAVSHLTSSTFGKRIAHEGLAFSTTRPNVIVGANGAGKTALLTLLSLQTLTHFTGETSLDSNFAVSRDADAWWSERTWRDDPVFLPGAIFSTDNAPALFYRPSHVPGNDNSVAAAMMCGYFEKAKAHGMLIRKKSSGEATRALLDRVIDVLENRTTIEGYRPVNWRGFSLEPEDLASQSYVASWHYRAEVLKRRRASLGEKLHPLVLLDEPEQSLDATNTLRLWSTIEKADCSQVQIIVATHSLYPFLRPEAFNLIEATPGYIEQVRSIIKSVQPDLG